MQGFFFFPVSFIFIIINDLVSIITIIIIYIFNYFPTNNKIRKSENKFVLNNIRQMLNKHLQRKC